MQQQVMVNRVAVFIAILYATVLWGARALSAQNPELKNEAKNIVLVHGAWADGSCWKGVYDTSIGV